MSYNVLNFDGKVVSSNRCLHDSNIGYEVDFSVNGEVDGWVYFNGIHTYGCWNNFLFGTLYDTQAVIGRHEPFVPTAADSFYVIRLVMKLVLKERVGVQIVPSTGRVAWRTLSNPLWANDKQYDFEIFNDGEWHTYFINLAGEQWWQGDVNDLRIYPILENGVSGDEFYIRTLEIISTENYKCLKVSCDYYDYYTQDCGGIGERGYCKSRQLPAYTDQGNVFSFAETKLYSVVEGVNDTLLVNINGYGLENIVLEPISSCSGNRMARILTKEISKLDVGGYAECDVEYTDMGEFIIYSGVYADDSTVSIGDTQLARDLSFFDDTGTYIFTRQSGRYPASGFIPYSSFKIKSHQIQTLLDSSSDTEFYFNPFIYNVEGGRRDWLNMGLGAPTKDMRASVNDDSGLVNRYYNQINNAGKTIIDFTHPFNASGRITKIYAAVTLDTFTSGDWEQRDTYDENRKETQLSTAKIMFFRPKKDGSIRVLPFELDILDRNHTAGKLYSAVQEYVEMDCDIFVNKGDLIGIYNANVYKGRSISGKEVDALYYHINGKAVGVLDLDTPTGQGSGGLLLYACSEQKQNRLVLDVDLGKRVNVRSVKIDGESTEEFLDYNIARCLDMDWEVDLFGGDHTTGYIVTYRPLVKAYYNHPNLYYGKNCLNDGIKVVSDGISADSFSVNYGNSESGYYNVLHQKDGGKGVVPVGAKYFQVNGDCEWIGVYLHAGKSGPFVMPDFQDDPIAFTIFFPFGKEKLIYKSKIYFKERYNFRSFGLSTYKGSYYVNGNADDPRFEYIPYRTDGTNTPWTRISLDGLDYFPEDVNAWADLNLYLADNPCKGHVEIETVRVDIHKYDYALDYFSDYAYEFSSTIRITNNDQFTQATAVDWNTLEHQWEPLPTSGFRFYCNHHQSTKICEFEVFCVAENIESSIAGSIDVAFSSYGDYWWPTKYSSTRNSITAFIGDTPRYINIVVKPITEINLKDIFIDVSYEDVFMGDKGCQYSFFPEETKLGVDNLPQLVNFKNVYGKPHNLFVDIVNNLLLDSGAVFFSKMNSGLSIVNPEIGADAYYKKQPNYPVLNYESNVAINCPVYSLKNLAVGAEAWFSHNKEYSWRYWGQLVDGKDINFSNVPNTRITTMNVPTLIRSKWWKVGVFDPRVSSKIREMRIYFQGEEILGVNFYHSKGQDAYNYPNEDTAVHLNNILVDGSYYVMTGNQYIGFELPSIQSFDQIVMYHDSLLEYENSHAKAGVDSSTMLLIQGDGDTYQTNTIVDYSYYEHAVSIVGNGIYCDEEVYDVGNYTFNRTFDSSEAEIVSDDFTTFSGTIWTSLINTTIVDGKLNVTNNTQAGQAVTNDYFYDNFDVTIDLNIEGIIDDEGWACQMELVTASGTKARVGRKYTSDNTVQLFFSSVFDGIIWEELETYITNDFYALKLRILRDGLITYFYGWDNDVFWIFLGSSEVLGTSPVKVRLVSDYIAPTSGVTTARFDNFYLINTARWHEESNYGSTFTCVSGTYPNGWAYYYDIGCSNRSNDSGYKTPKVFEVQDYPIDHKYTFNMEFVLNVDNFKNSSGTELDYYSDIGIAVGIFGHHIATYGYFPYQRYFTGAQVYFCPTRVGIAIKNDWNNLSETYVALEPRDGPYYCRFTGDGNGNYSCYVWTDALDGANQVANFSLTSSYFWQGVRVGIGSCYSYVTYTAVPHALGWISDLNFTCNKVLGTVFGQSAIRFNAVPDEKILVDYDNNPNCNIFKDGFDFDTKRFTIDFYIKFATLLNDSSFTPIHIIKSWHEDQIFSVGTPIQYPSSWIFTIERTDYLTYYWRFYVNVGGYCRRVVNYSFTPEMHRWYHFYLCRGPANGQIADVVLLRDGHQIFYTNDDTQLAQEILYSGQDVSIGQNLDGWLREVRVSSDYTLGGGRCETSNTNYFTTAKSIPTAPYEHYYTLSFFESTDNIHYGKVMDVDVLFDNSYSYHEEFSVWSENYYSYFAIDLGQRFNLGLVRSYPVDTALAFSINSNILYSNKDTSDPVEAFLLTEGETELSTEFEGQNYDYPFNWIKMDTDRATSYIIDGGFYQLCNPLGSQQYCKSKSKFHFYGDFDFYINYDLGTTQVTSNSWNLNIQLEDIYSEDRNIKFMRGFDSGNSRYKVDVRDGSPTWTSKYILNSNDARGTIRVVRKGSIFTFYLKNIDEDVSEFVLLFSYQFSSTSLAKEMQLYLGLVSDTSTYPRVGAWWNSFVVNSAAPVYSDYTDARWLRVKLYNGDGVTRTINSLGIYPDVSVQRTEAGQYNTYWESLGTAITSYDSAENIALGATVSGSSYVGTMFPSNAVNGITASGELGDCWGADEEAHPWLNVYFNQIESIFRFKIYHGFNTSESDNLILDYRIQTSLDGVSFTTIFDINGNSSFSRTHDLTTPVQAKVVRFYVDSYKSRDRYVWAGEDGFKFWSGAVLREIEIYKYYGFTSINSEDSPIIAIDLQQPYFISSHSLIGINTENTTTDWSNSDSNFAWSNSNLDDPHKVTFGEWSADPGYAKWAVIMRNTATKFPTTSDAKDYLKHVVIKASPDESGRKPNPVEYPWMWRSNVSTLSYDYGTITDGDVNRSLRIDYPAGIAAEHVRFIEGDHFDIDTSASWRDGFGFKLYVDNLDNLDLSYGYFYFGGKDYTSGNYPVVYRWNMTTFSGSLVNGWNNLNLTFLYADDIVYTELSAQDGRDPRRLYTIDWGTIGFIFRGVGNNLRLNFEEFYIKRNHFEHGSAPDQRGLYLHTTDIMKVHVGELDFHSGTIEFWIRPDWNWDGRDIFNDFKFRTLFHFGNVANDIFGAAVSSRGLEVYYGNLLNDFNLFIVSGFGFNSIDRSFHMAFVFSNDGTRIGSDASTIRVYINNYLFAKSTNTWSVSDDKHFNFVLGGQGLLAQKTQGFDPTASSMDAVVSRLKIYNYCKTDFSDSTYGSIVTQRRLSKPSDFIEISKDNVTFYKVGSTELPFFFEQVPVNDEIPIWVKVRLPENLIGAEKRTSKILGSWDVGV